MQVSVRRQRGIGWFWLGAVLLFAAGCGLTDYENRMAKEQDRLAYIEEENKQLAGPIRLPEKREGEDKNEIVTNQELFFRPPRGVFANPEEKPVAAGVYRYRSSDASLPEMYVAVTHSKKPDEFRKAFLKAVGAGEVTLTSRVAGERSGRPITLRSVSLDSPTTQSKWFVYFYGDGPYAALAFRVSAAEAASAATATRLDYSLASLALGPFARQRQLAYDRGNRTAGGKR